MDDRLRHKYVNCKLRMRNLMEKNKAFSPQITSVHKKRGMIIFNLYEILNEPPNFAVLGSDEKIAFFLYLLSTHIVASCEMDLHDFPMDTQHCKLSFGSCKYSFHLISLLLLWYAVLR